MGRDVKPGPDEYGEYFASYVEDAPVGDVVETLGRQMRNTANLLSGLSESAGNHRYAPDKWSVKELLGHLIDAERVFGVRALAFARGDPTELPGFSHDDYVRAGRFDLRSLASLAEEFRLVRASHLLFFGGLERDAWDRTGVANGHAFTVRALAYILAGHENHHLRVLRERYL